MTNEEAMQILTDMGLHEGGMDNWVADNAWWKFSNVVEQHVRRAMNEEAKAHLEELRKNFNAESAELRLHQWSQEKQA